MFILSSGPHPQHLSLNGIKLWEWRGLMYSHCTGESKRSALVLASHMHCPWSVVGKDPFLDTLLCVPECTACRKEGARRVSERKQQECEAYCVSAHPHCPTLYSVRAASWWSRASLQSGGRAADQRNGAKTHLLSAPIHQNKCTHAPYLPNTSPYQDFSLERGGQDICISWLFCSIYFPQSPWDRIGKPRLSSFFKSLFCLKLASCMA